MVEALKSSPNRLSSEELEEFLCDVYIDHWMKTDSDENKDMHFSICFYENNSNSDDEQTNAEAFKTTVRMMKLDHK